MRQTGPVTSEPSRKQGATNAPAPRVAFVKPHQNVEERGADVVSRGLSTQQKRLLKRQEDLIALIRKNGLALATGPTQSLEGKPEKSASKAERAKSVAKNRAGKLDTSAGVRELAQRLGILTATGKLTASYKK